MKTRNVIGLNHDGHIHVFVFDDESAETAKQEIYALTFDYDVPLRVVIRALRSVERLVGSNQKAEGSCRCPWCYDDVSAEMG